MGTGSMAYVRVNVFRILLIDHILFDSLLPTLEHLYSGLT